MASPEAARLKQAFDELMASVSGTEESPVSIADMRAMLDAFMSRVATMPTGVTWTPVEVGGVPGLWSKPVDGTDDRTILYLHGGGYVVGCPEGYKYLTGHLAKTVGCRVLSIDYRMPPDHPFPAALEDSTQAYRWLLESGVKPTSLAICGDSAGGGLTLATLVALRNADVPLPAAAVAISPWTDLAQSGETFVSNAAHDHLQKEMLDGMAGMYLNGRDPDDPLAAPVHADLTGLPPLYIQVGDRETLFDDAKVVAHKAMSAGVDITLDVLPEMFHDCHVGVGRVPEADAALARFGTFLRSRLGLDSEA